MFVSGETPGGLSREAPNAVILLNPSKTRIKARPDKDNSKEEDAFFYRYLGITKRFRFRFGFSDHCILIIFY